MKKKANKSPETTWFEKLVAAFTRCHKSPIALSRETGLHRKTITTWLRTQPAKIRNQAAVEKALDDFLARPYISGPNPNGVARVWQSMRVLKNFTVSDLAATANVSVNHCQRIAKLLADSGYVRRNKDRIDLLKDTGPVPPQISHNHKILIDKNISQGDNA